jgi:hypothetical protein
VRYDNDADLCCPATPQPASQPTNEQTARWYEAFTAGQLRAVHLNGQWFMRYPYPGEGPVTQAVVR